MIDRYYDSEYDTIVDTIVDTNVVKNKFEKIKIKWSNVVLSNLSLLIYADNIIEVSATDIYNALKQTMPYSKIGIEFSKHVMWVMGFNYVCLI